MKTKTLALYALLTTSALATPSGFNNIPSTDLVPHRTVAVQAWSSFGGANQFAANGPGEHSFWMGFKTGLTLTEGLNLEWGLDSPLGLEQSGPLFGQTKLGFHPWEGGAFSLGVANVAITDINRASDPFSYAVLSHDFGPVRLHGGYGLQTNGNSYLLGIDHTFKINDHDLNLNADLVQTRDQDGWIAAVGAKYAVNKHIMLESWVNLPDEGEASAILKINFIFTF
jgi:hypothetical protein